MYDFTKDRKAIYYDPLGSIYQKWYFFWNSTRRASGQVGVRFSAVTYKEAVRVCHPVRGRKAENWELVLPDTDSQ